MRDLLGRQVRIGRRFRTQVGTLLRWAGYWIVIAAIAGFTVAALKGSPA